MDAKPVIKDALLRVREVVAKTGKSRSEIYADVKTGAFPQSVRVGSRAVAWRESELDAWIAARSRKPVGERKRKAA
jgi:prophage regulatory protein